MPDCAVTSPGETTLKNSPPDTPPVSAGASTSWPSPDPELADTCAPAGSAVTVSEPALSAPHRRRRRPWTAAPTRRSR